MVRRALGGAVIGASVAALLGFPLWAGGAAAGGVGGVLRLSHGCPGPTTEGDTRRCDFAGSNIVVRAFREGAAAAVGFDRTDGNGRFGIALPPGRYVLRAEVAKAKATQTAVSVRAAAWTSVTLRYLIPPYML